MVVSNVHDLLGCSHDQCLIVSFSAIRSFKVIPFGKLVGLEDGLLSGNLTTCWRLDGITTIAVSFFV